MVSSARHEVESDAQKTFQKLAACFDGPDGISSDAWLSISRLCERLSEEADRGYHLAKTEETLERVRQSGLAGPKSSDEPR